MATKEKTIPPTTIPVASPNPAETVLMVKINPGLMDAGDGKPINTRYRDCPKTLIDPSKVTRGYGDYVLIDVKNGDNAIYWFFGKTRTDEERATPYLDYTEKRPDVPWPNVLKWVEFGEDYGFPLSQETIDSRNRRTLVIAGRPVIRYTWLPAMSLTTKVRVRKFLSERPFPDHELVSDEPIPTDVSFDYIGKDGGFPKCLHDDIRVPGTQNDYRALSSAGTPERFNNTADNSQFFPKTNHKDWQTYVVNTSRRMEGLGLYERTEETFFVPNRPKLSERQQ